METSERNTLKKTLRRIKAEDSIYNEYKKAPNELTTFQIRLFDNRTGSVFYKQLTRDELLSITSLFDVIEWH